MGRRSRLILLLLALILFVVVGRYATGSFSFLVSDFWSTAGLLLLILLSLVDQPFFSKDANIFINGSTAWVSLLLVPNPERDWIWWSFLGWATYLVASSYGLMWLRARPLRSEPLYIQFLSRLNREVGKPEAIFSAFFLWGCVRQFGYNSPQLNALLLFWAIFIIVNIPAIASAVDRLFTGTPHSAEDQGELLGIVSPRIAEALVPASAPPQLLTQLVNIRLPRGASIATAVVIDDRVLAGKRIARLAIVNATENWQRLAEESGRPAVLEFMAAKFESATGDTPLAVVSAASDIGAIHITIHPDMALREGELLWVDFPSGVRAFYQIISAVVRQHSALDGNSIQTVEVAASQLGIWEESRCRFEPVTWVAPAGQLVFRATSASHPQLQIPARHAKLGQVPNSDFPVHVNLEDVVTHNTGIIGVTGSGKTFLALRLIEEITSSGIKVLILDISRQHFVHLSRLNPQPVPRQENVEEWFRGDSLIGVHQFAESQSYPRTTADFVDAAFHELSKITLRPGRNEPAKLCVVFEEAHALIPEWNQVAAEPDKNQVNRTARALLQGRKFGMGAIVISQRTANVTKTILNQCNTICALQSFDQTGLDFLRNYMGEQYAHAISTLPSRHAILVGKASSSTRPILFEIEDLGARWTQEANGCAEEGGPQGL